MLRKGTKNYDYSGLAAGMHTAAAPACGGRSTWAVVAAEEAAGGAAVAAAAVGAGDVGADDSNSASVRRSKEPSGCWGPSWGREQKSHMIASTFRHWSDGQ